MSVSTLLMVILGAIASLLVLAVGLKGQISIGQEVSIPVHQEGQGSQLNTTDRILLTWFVPTGATDAAPARGKTKNALERLKGLRVQVLLSDPMGGLTTGSGFWISSGGLVITCWRNLSQNPDGIVTVKSTAAAGRPMQGTLLAQDIHKNLGLIHVEPNPFAQTKPNSITHNPRPQVAIPAPHLPQIGDRLFVVVAQSGRPDLAQERSVAAVRPVIELGGELKILLSGVTRFGYAGEPVIDESGHVVGILEGPYPSPDRTKWGTTEVVIPIQAALELMRGM